MSVVKRFHFSDINKRFTKNAYGDISVKFDDDAVKEAIENILMCGDYDFVMEPNLGVGISRLLFEPIDNRTTHYMQMAIETHLPQREPRINVLNVNIVPDYERLGYDITITIQIKGTDEIVNVRFFLEQQR